MRQAPHDSVLALRKLKAREIKLQAKLALLDQQRDQVATELEDVRRRFAVESERISEIRL